MFLAKFPDQLQTYKACQILEYNRALAEHQKRRGKKRKNKKKEFDAQNLNKFAALSVATRQEKNFVRSLASFLAHFFTLLDAFFFYCFCVAENFLFLITLPTSTSTLLTL